MLVYLVTELWLENYFHTLEHDTSKNDKNVGKQAFLYLGCRHALLIEIGEISIRWKCALN